jgi:hypothetical protein
MPENFGDLRQRRASSDHLSGQTVTEQVSRTSTRASHSGSRKRLPNDVAYSRRTSQADMWWIHSLEHSPKFAYAAILTNV